MSMFSSIKPKTFKQHKGSTRARKRLKFYTAMAFVTIQILTVPFSPLVHPSVTLCSFLQIWLSLSLLCQDLLPALLLCWTEQWGVLSFASALCFAYLWCLGVQSLLQGSHRGIMNHQRISIKQGKKVCISMMQVRLKNKLLLTCEHPPPKIILLSDRLQKLNFW